MSTTPESRPGDVLLAADVGSYSLAAIDLAVRMAASVNTRLCGVFIEDEDLLRIVGLPFTREVSLTTAVERPTSVTQMQGALRRAAQQFRQNLQQQAQSRQIEWRFDCIRGRLHDLGQNPDPDVHYIILGHRQGRRTLRAGRPGTRRILLLAPRSRQQQHALDVALELFGGDKIELTLLNEASGGASTETIEDLAAQADSRIRWLTIGRDQLRELLARRPASFDCAILPRHGKSKQTMRLLKSLECPVILTA